MMRHSYPRCRVKEAQQLGDGCNIDAHVNIATQTYVHATLSSQSASTGVLSHPVRALQVSALIRKKTQQRGDN